MEQIRIQLMTTLGCHLCEQALAMVEYLNSSDHQLHSSITLESVEISESDTLIEEFGVRIPVLVSGNKQLCWPFELNELKDWLINQD